MKRPTESTKSNPSVKKAKTADIRDAPAESVSAQPLTAKQLKAFQCLMAAASFTVVMKGCNHGTLVLGTTAERKKCYDYYHGHNEDTKGGLVRNFLTGFGRFGILWDSGRIAAGYGHLSGVSHESIKDVIYRAKVEGERLISGRKIMERAEETLHYASLFLASWMGFLVHGRMPIGKNEDDALQYVLMRSKEEKWDGSYSVMTTHTKHKMF